MLIDRLKAQLGVWLNGVSYNIDIVNGCCLSCPSCAVGSIGKRDQFLMNIENFRRILNKAQNEGGVRRVQMYAYSDPCQHPDLHLFVSECTQRSIPVYLSTVLQETHCDFVRVIDAYPAEFRISFAGFKQMRYYQGGASPEAFKKKLNMIARLPRYKETTWTMAFHLYRDNEIELEYARSLAESLALKFVVIPAIFMPCEKVVDKHYTDADLALISHLIESPEDNIARMKFKRFCTCWKQITMDALGDVYLCQLVYEKRFRLCNFMDVPLSDIRMAIRTHTFCEKCVMMGGNVMQECFADFIKYDDPVGVANKRRMKRVKK